MLKDQPKYWLPSDTLYVYLTKLPSNNKTRTLYPLWVDNRLFTVLCLVTWSLDGSEAGGDLALIQTSLLWSCKCT